METYSIAKPRAAKHQVRDGMRYGNPGTGTLRQAEVQNAGGRVKGRRAHREMSLPLRRMARQTRHYGQNSNRAPTWILRGLLTLPFHSPKALLPVVLATL